MKFKLKIKYALLLLFTINYSVSVAQIKGYHGKRFIVGYDLTFFPSHVRPNKNFNSDLFTSYNDVHYLNLEYIVKQKMSLGIKIGTYRSGLIFSDIISYFDENPYGYNQINYEVYNTEIGGLDYEFRIKQYLRHPAPLGVYLCYIVGLRSAYVLDSKVKLKEYFGYQYYPIDPNTPVKEYISYEDKLKFLTLGLEIGKERVIFDKIILKFGFAFKYVVTNTYNNSYEYSYSRDSNADKRFVMSHIKTRIQNHAMLNFTIGAGFLAF